MTEYYATSNDFLDLSKRYEAKKNVRQTPIPQLIEAENVIILGQDNGMLLIQLELSIDKKPYTFIGPMQVVREPKSDDRYSNIQTLNLEFAK